MSKVNKMRIWNNNELTIAYYVSKYGTLNGLNMKKEEIVNYIIGNTTERSFDMQVANFNYIMGVGDYQLEHTSKAQRDLVDALANKTVTQVRKMILDYAISIDEKVEARKAQVANEKVSTRTQQLNDELNRNFEAKIANMRRMGRRLTPVKK